MKRDYSLIRQIVKMVSTGHLVRGQAVDMPDTRHYESDFVEYQVQLAIEGGLVYESPDKNLRLTWKGNDFIEKCGNQYEWDEVMRLSHNGEVPFETLDKMLSKMKMM